MKNLGFDAPKIVTVLLALQQVLPTITINCYDGDYVGVVGEVRFSIVSGYNVAGIIVNNSFMNRKYFPLSELSNWSAVEEYYNS